MRREQTTAWAFPGNGQKRSGSNGRRAIFLDRDGVINSMVYNGEFGLVDSPQNPQEFKLLPGVGEAIRLINEMGFLAVVVSNQPGIAKGKHNHNILAQITDKMLQKLAGASAHLDAIYYCLHHPEAVREEYRVICDCRKPKSGMLIQASQELEINLAHSYMIGDGLTDVLAGQAAGCHTIFLGQSKCEVCRMMNRLGARPDHIAPSLPAAVHLIRQTETNGGDVMAIVAGSAVVCSKSYIMGGEEA
jgi:D-glycero-D-manno-heptose 1,7-bisphosphate phosphatase